MTNPTSSDSCERGFVPLVDKLLEPLLDVIRYYPDREFERRTLIFTWAANLVKPMAVTEVTEILGYGYRRVRELFIKLVQSGVLSEVDDGERYCCIGDSSLTLYVQKGIVRGRPLPGRLPTMYIFRKRLDIDPEQFRRQFNEFGLEIIRYVERKTNELAEEISPIYHRTLLADWNCIVEKVTRVFRMLVNEGIISISRTQSYADVKVKLRQGEIRYAVPRVERLNSLF
jgi:hypothetical protein